MQPDCATAFSASRPSHEVRGAPDVIPTNNCPRRPQEKSRFDGHATICRVNKNDDNGRITSSEDSV